MSEAGRVVWFTGLPRSGKSTLASRAQRRFEREGRRCALLDGDEVRAQVFPWLGHSEADRDRFYAALGQLAALLARQGQLVLVAATAHRAAYRSAARALAPGFIEVFVDVPPEECERRDAKGLYRQAREGALKTQVPGVSAAYERPVAPELRATGGEDDAALERLSALLRGPNPC